MLCIAGVGVGCWGSDGGMGREKKQDFFLAPEES